MSVCATVQPIRRGADRAVILRTSGLPTQQRQSAWHTCQSWRVLQLILISGRQAFLLAADMKETQ